MRTRSRSGGPARQSVLRRAIVGLILGAVLAFLLVGLAAVLVARPIALDNAMDEAERSAHANSIVPFAPSVMV